MKRLQRSKTQRIAGRFLYAKLSADVMRPLTQI